MFDSVIDEGTKKSIEIISSLPFAPSFYLAGGTGCAMHLGHRISHDLDFFFKERFSHSEIRDTLKEYGHFVVDYSDSQTLVGRFNETKVSFFHYDYLLIETPQEFFGMNIASLKDIGCMKIDAISSRGCRRDFVDLYFILKNMNLSLKEFFPFFEKKYGSENYNIYHILKSLVYFADAEKDPELNMLTTYSWDEVKGFFEQQIKSFE